MRDGNGFRVTMEDKERNRHAVDLAAEKVIVIYVPDLPTDWWPRTITLHRDREDPLSDKVARLSRFTNLWSDVDVDCLGGDVILWGHEKNEMRKSVRK